ncbi:MAG: 16S rRNA (cytosine(1402)-N(4))-methyltransferase [Candidatus Solincola sediminis]|uniref:Ribosomal RNA small subunit methyltransferase H n=1 Tax=Candidatus Solincola sediminis TaxID=1797199 RepID=A0A1F2WS35_9ACTN|nr:MAG: 16S rRNA (cytosine(1402)-N(4))-methyltransferase [Candidatus Solincola sediminis]OFW60947.1 MAG: 16S rRNA (cytosine(1402)-N(4))-methyltransferase [Candidatus Solincola sediminis]
MEEGEVVHVPVLLHEVIGHLNPRPGIVLVDATVGDGGHALALLEDMGGEGCLIGLDRDKQALERARLRLRRFGEQVILYHANFSQLEEVLEDVPEESSAEGVNGFLFDLGVSSLQLGEAERGFSFRQPARLDMRMDTDRELDAWKVVNRYEERELARIIREYGEERWASRIARRIAIERKRAPIDTTDRLAEIIKDSIPAAARRTGGHPARRTFQALRLEVNGELRSLEEALPQTVQWLKKGGRIAVISYHSLEDRIVKRFFSEHGSFCRCSMDFAGCTCEAEETLRIVTRKPVTPSQDEITANPRARSAKLRVAEKR